MAKKDKELVKELVKEMERDPSIKLLIKQIRYVLDTIKDKRKFAGQENIIKKDLKFEDEK